MLILETSLLAMCLSRPGAGTCAEALPRQEVIDSHARADAPLFYFAKRQASPYTPQSTWYKIKNPTYTQAENRPDLFEKNRR